MCIQPWRLLQVSLSFGPGAARRTALITQCSRAWYCVNHRSILPCMVSGHSSLNHSSLNHSSLNPPVHGIVSFITQCSGAWYRVIHGHASAWHACVAYTIPESTPPRNLLHPRMLASTPHLRQQMPLKCAVQGTRQVIEVSAAD